METISQNLEHILNRIRAVELQAKRKPNSVKLIAVSKMQSVNSIKAAIAVGQHAFGENYLQEALPKIIALKNYDIEWHFIGPIQSNKTREIAEHFDWVQSLDRIKIAQRLNDQRPANLPPLQICIQINTSHATHKSGISLSELPQFIVALKAFPRLQLRGLMTMITPDYVAVAHAFHALKARGINIDTLSMGMSDDFESAIAVGATMVRIGTLLFGERKL